MEPDELFTTMPAGRLGNVRITPLPGCSLIVSSLAVIAASTVLASFGVAMITVPDPAAFIYGAAIVFLSCLVGTLQYAACFRPSLRAAKKLIYLHGVGFFVFVCHGSLMVVVTIEAANKSSDLVRPLLLAVFMLFLALLAAWNLWILWRWSMVLSANQYMDPEDVFQKKRPFQVSILELLLIMTAVALVAGLASWMIRMHS